MMDDDDIPNPQDLQEVEDLENGLVPHSLRHVPRLSAETVLNLCNAIRPFSKMKYIPKQNLLDATDPDYVRFCDRYKIAVFANLQCESVGKSLAILGQFIKDGSIDIGALRKVRGTAQTERARIDEFYKETNLDTCKKCGKNRARPAMTEAPGYAETMLGVMERWNNDPPLQKAAFHSLRILLRDGLTAVPQPHRP